MVQINYEKFCSDSKKITHFFFGYNISSVLTGVLSVTKFFQIMQLITSSQFNINHFDWLNFCHSDQNFGHLEHTRAHTGLVRRFFFVFQFFKEKIIFRSDVHDFIVDRVPTS
jgi:hypothetical protein